MWTLPVACCFFIPSIRFANINYKSGPPTISAQWKAYLAYVTRLCVGRKTESEMLGSITAANREKIKLRLRGTVHTIPEGDSEI
jgi:hypothetical protein